MRRHLSHPFLFGAILCVLPSLHAEAGLSALSTTAGSPHLDDPYHGDRWEYKDGTYRYSLEVAGGVALPAGSTRHYQNTAGAYRLGIRANLNKHIGALFEYDFNDFGVPATEINRFNLVAYPKVFGGRVHLWSLSLNPVVNLFHTDTVTGYIVGGGGFYRKLVDFNAPLTCYASCPPPGPDYSVRGFSNNAPGLNIGVGITKKLKYGGMVKSFAEIRYVWVDNHSGPHDGSYAPTYYRTGYFPMLIGLKW